MYTEMPGTFANFTRSSCITSLIVAWCAKRGAVARSARPITGTSPYFCTSRVIVGLGIIGRSSGVFKWMKMKPVFELPPTVPRLEKNPLRYGSFTMMRVNSSWCAFIESNEMPCCAIV